METHDGQVAQAPADAILRSSLRTNVSIAVVYLQPHKLPQDPVIRSLFPPPFAG